MTADPVSNRPLRQNRLRRRLQVLRRSVQVWSGRRLPPGMRLVVGVLLIIGGLFGFLPVVGVWMLPLGVTVAALDIRPIWRYLFGK